MLICSTKEFYSLYQDVLGKSRSFHLKVKGGSMYPFIKSGDQLEFQPFGPNNGFQNIKTGNIILFIKDDFFYVHRVINKRYDCVVTKGDAAFSSDGIIPRANIFAKVISIRRKGHNYSLSSWHNRSLAIILAKFWFVWQYLVQFFSKLLTLVQIVLLRIQKARFYRLILKKFFYEKATIREGADKDRENLRDLYLMYEPDAAVGLEKTKKDGFWLVAEGSSKILGALTIHKDDKSAGRWFIFGLVVKPLYRGQGIGEKLVKAAMVKAKLSGGEEIGLFVNSRAIPAVKLYKKLGFTVRAKFPAGFVKPEDKLYMLWT